MAGMEAPEDITEDPVGTDLAEECTTDLPWAAVCTTIPRWAVECGTGPLVMEAAADACSP